MKDLLEAHFRIFPFFSFVCTSIIGICFIIASRKNHWSKAELWLGMAAVLAILCSSAQLAGLSQLKLFAEYVSIFVYLAGVLRLAFGTYPAKAKPTSHTEEDL